MAIQTPFTSVSQQLINYNWIDIFKGVGYISYYPMIAVNSTTTEYILSPTIMDSNTPLVQANATPQDMDFDLSFNQEEDIKGDFLFNFTQRPGSSGAAGTCNTTINIYHVDISNTETLLATKTTPTRSGSGTYHRENLRINVSLKHFSPGEKLRINVIFTGSANIGNIYIDPSSGLSFTDTYTRTIGSDFISKVPFVVEII